MHAEARPRVALITALLALALGCASRPERPAEYVPPRLDLARYQTLGVVEFASVGKAPLGSAATEEFVTAVHAAQPGTPVLALGAARGALTPEAVRALAKREGVDALFVGEIAESKSKPRVSIEPTFASGAVSSERKAKLSVRLLDGATGAAVWSAMSERTIPVVAANGAFGELPNVRTTPADEARAILVHDLVDDVTFDFRPRWVRR
jgi:hypothetical protein